MRIRLHGWFGFRNLGDDLLLQKALDVLGGSGAVSSIEVSVRESGYLQGFLRTDKPLSFAGRGMGSLFKAALHQDALVVGPGGLFPHRNLPKVAVYLVLTAWWKLLGRKVAYFGLGATSSQDAFSAFCWRRIAALSDLFVCRDSDLLDACGIAEGERAFAASDMVFLDGPSGQAGENGRIAVALANLFSDGEEGLEAFADGCVSIVSDLAEGGQGVDLLSFTAGRDEDLNEAIASKLIGRDIRVLDYSETLSAALAGLERYRLVLGMRFHSVLLAARGGVRSLPFHTRIRRSGSLPALG